MRRIKQKDYIQITGIIFLVISALHLLRVFLGWRAIIGGLEIPIWASIVGFAVAGYLAYSAFGLKK